MMIFMHSSLNVMKKIHNLSSIHIQIILDLMALIVHTFLILVDDLMKICISEKEDTIKTLITLISILIILRRLSYWKIIKIDF
jgi:hypothetical protein